MKWLLMPARVLAIGPWRARGHLIGRRFARQVLAALAVGVLVAPASVRVAGLPAQAERRGLEIQWIDVEGGAATLIVTPAGESVLVDTGWPGARDAERIKEALSRVPVSRVDHLVTTHWHQDHFGGVSDVAQRVQVGRYYDHGFPKGPSADIDPRLKAAYLALTHGGSTVLRPGDAIALRQAPGSPPVSLRVVSARGLVGREKDGAPQIRSCRAHPAHASRPEDPSDNYRSVGFVLAFGDFQFLDLGDLTWNVEHKLACPKNLVGAVDVYQVTHHGNDDSNNPVLLQAVAPAVAIMNNGARKGGKPEVYRRLKAVASIRDVYQVHRNVESGPDDNAPPPFVANDEAECRGQWVRLVVDPAAQTYTVEVPSKGTRRTYEVR
jgi:beta-lactamase superfamily II metal-dependent hydrolase